MNAYNYLYRYFQHFCSVQQRSMYEAAAASIALDAAAPAATSIAERREQHG